MKRFRHHYGAYLATISLGFTIKFICGALAGAYLLRLVTDRVATIPQLENGWPVIWEIILFATPIFAILNLGMALALYLGGFDRRLLRSDIVGVAYALLYYPTIALFGCFRFGGWSLLMPMVLYLIVALIFRAVPRHR